PCPLMPLFLFLHQQSHCTEEGDAPRRQPRDVRTQPAGYSARGHKKTFYRMVKGCNRKQTDRMKMSAETGTANYSWPGILLPYQHEAVLLTCRSAHGTAFPISQCHSDCRSLLTVTRSYRTCTCFPFQQNAYAFCHLMLYSIIYRNYTTLYSTKQAL